MRKIAGLAVLVLIVASVMLTAGCTGTDETPTATTEEMNFGYQPSTHQIAYMAAMDKGWWSENLAPFGYTIDKSKNEYQFPTGAPEMQSMIAGDIDVAYVGAAPVISALATGLDGKIVAAVQTQGSALVVGNGITYEKPEDLIGHTIATFPPGTIQDTLLRGWLRENGIDDENDVDIRPMGPGDAITAITAGQIDAVLLPAPSPTIIENDGVGRIVVNSGEMMKDHPCCVLVVSGKMIRENPDAVVEIVKTHIEATDYIKANKAEAAEIFSGYTKNSVETVMDSFNNWDGEWVSDPNIITEGVMDYVKTQAELGYIEKELTQDEIFDFSFYEKATA